MPSDLEVMYSRVLKALEGVQYASRETPVFAKAMEWIKSFPRDLDNSLRVKLMHATCKSFNLSEAELLLCLEGSLNGLVKTQLEAISREVQLRKILPKGGWFEFYDKYTMEIEPPLSYLIFSSMCVLSCALGRRVYRRMGHFTLFPNYCVLLIGPTGRVKKTTAGDIAAKFIRSCMLCPILADKVTPESLVRVLKDSGHHFAFSPEMAVFFGRQKYNEGLVETILRLLDCPSEYIVETMARGTEILTDLAVTFLGCTTQSLLTTSMPEEVTSSGFMNRFVLVVERDTERVFPSPGVPPADMEDKLMRTAERLKSFSGEMTLSKEADQWYDQWYRERRVELRRITDDTLVEVLERTPTHLLRTAMLVHLVQCDNMDICLECIQNAHEMMKYVEVEAPKTVQALKQSSGANDMDLVTLTLKKLGGAADHSTLIRRVASKMNAQQLKLHIKTLEESGVVRVTKKGAATFYYLEGGIE